MEFKLPYISYDYAASPSGDAITTERRMARRDDNSTYLVDIGTYDTQAAINACTTLDVQAVIDAYTHGNTQPMQLNPCMDVDYTALPDNPYALHRALSLARQHIDNARIASTTPAEAAKPDEEVSTT